MAREMNALQMQLYTDDSVEAVFEDGSKLELSPCASVFLYSKSVSISAPIVQQTRFALSQYKAAIDKLIEFRNTWAEKAFICAVQGEVKVKGPLWPSGDYVHRLLTTTSNGGRRIRSVDGSGYVELHGHKQTCDVSFSVAVGKSRLCQHAFTTTRLSSNKATEFDVCTIVQKHSVVDAAATPGGVHQWWEYPLSLLLGATPSPVSSAGPCTGDTTLPGVVHGLCSRTRLHKWTTTQGGGGGDGKTPGLQEAKVLKVLWTSEGFTFRLHYSPQVFLEIFCSDGTFARSHDSSGRYFTCWSPSNKDSSTVIWSERVFSTEHAPPFLGSNQGLSLARAFGRGERLLYTASQLRDAATCATCWNNKEGNLTPLPPPTPLTPLHSLTPVEVQNALPILPATQSCVAIQEDVEGVGCFKAYVSGRIVVHFQDTAHLETYLSAMDSQRRGYVRGGEGGRRVEGTCWLRLPNGRTETVPLKFTGNRYVAMTKEWCDWLCNPLDTRGSSFHPKTCQRVSPALCEATVQQELRKINSVLCGQQGDPPSEQDIASALEQTRHALNDLTSLINSNTAVSKTTR